MGLHSWSTSISTHFFKVFSKKRYHWFASLVFGQICITQTAIKCKNNKLSGGYSVLSGFQNNLIVFWICSLRSRKFLPILQCRFDVLPNDFYSINYWSVFNPSKMEQENAPYFNNHWDLGHTVYDWTEMYFMYVRNFKTFANMFLSSLEELLKNPERDA